MHKQVHETSLWIPRHPACLQLQHWSRRVPPWQAGEASAHKYKTARVHPNDDHAKGSGRLLWPCHQGELVPQASPAGKSPGSRTSPTMGSVEVITSSLFTLFLFYPLSWSMTSRMVVPVWGCFPSAQRSYQRKTIWSSRILVSRFLPWSEPLISYAAIVYVAWWFYGVYILKGRSAENLQDWICLSPSTYLANSTHEGCWMSTSPGPLVLSWRMDGWLQLMTLHMYSRWIIPSRCSTFMKGLYLHTLHSKHLWLVS